MRYKPTALREKETFPVQIKYGVGIEDSPGSFGMTHGPYDSMEECLEEVPFHEDRDIFILKLPIGKKLWRWNVEDQEWEKL